MAPSKSEDAPEVSQKSADAPQPSKNESVLTEKDHAEIAFTDKYSSPDVYINGETDTLWFPWVGPIELKPLRMETRTGTFVVVLRSPVDAWLGKHRHRGSVTALTVSGSWRYKEYDWVARPGDYVVENPGTIHTLFVSGGAEIVFTITGSLEFFNEDDSLKDTLDIFSFSKMYYDHCKEKGLKPNDGLWY